MSTVAMILRYELQNARRSRWLFGYALLLLLLTDGLLRLGGGGPRAVLSLSSVVLVFVPLVSIVFGSLYLYNSRDFVELLLAQPIRRSALFAGMYGGLALPLAAAFAVGVGVPFLYLGGRASTAPVLVLIGTGVMLTVVFTALAFLASLLIDDRARGLGACILLWLVLTLLYDGALLFVVTAFGDYPLERPLLALTMLNPVDLGRILLLLQLDVAALMGYTGAVFERFFGSAMGMVLSGGALLCWAALPLAWAARRFARKDF